MQLSDDFPMMMEREAGMPDQVPQVAVAFGFYPVIDNKKTKEAGRDIYKDVEFVKIAIPGDRNSLFFQPAEQSHRLRFPKAYESFKQREVNPVEGTPIEQWAVVSRSVALNLRAAHVHTVEALANVHDGNIDRIGGNGRELREKARAWLSDAKDGAAAVAHAAEKKALQDQLASLQAQINAMKAPPQKGAAPAAQHVPVTPPADVIDAALEDDIARDVAAAARRPRRS